MSILVALILGIIQGLTEFLPVSSSGHLVLFQKIFGIESNLILFDVILHLGTLIAVVIVYRKSILELIKHPFSKKMGYLVIGTIPTVIIALLFKDFFESAFNGNILFVGFLATSLLLFIASYCDRKYKNYKTLKAKHIFVMGLFQGLAILPGLSRSGSTTCSSIVMGIKKEETLEYSFLLSIPIILASLVYELIFSKVTFVSSDILPIIIGFVSSAIFGIFSIIIMKKVIKKNNYKYFAIYLIILSCFLILNQYVLHLF